MIRVRSVSLRSRDLMVDAHFMPPDIMSIAREQGMSDQANTPVIRWCDLVFYSWEHGTIRRDHERWPSLLAELHTTNALGGAFLSEAAAERGDEYDAGIQVDWTGYDDATRV